MKIVRAPRGTKRLLVDVNDINIPNIWSLHLQLKKEGRLEDAEEVHETWNLAHDMLQALKDIDNAE